jgi:PilZ domain
MKKDNYPIKRSNPRFTFSAEAEAVLRDGTSVDAQVFELSARGCYIDTVKPISMGTELTLRISNGMSMCELQGKVIYTHPGGGMGVFGMGIVFEDMAAEQRVELESWLRDLAGGQSQPSTAEMTQ